MCAFLWGTASDIDQDVWLFARGLTCCGRPWLARYWHEGPKPGFASRGLAPATKQVKITALFATIKYSRMPRVSKLAVGSADETETAFYEALQAGDLDRLMACWADDDEVVCIHPGGPRLIGLGAIRSAFDTLFANGSVRLHIEAVHKVVSMGCAVHSVRERIEIATNEGPVEAHVLATNVYVKTAQGWRLVAHHASPSTGLDTQDVTEKPPIYH